MLPLLSLLLGAAPDCHIADAQRVQRHLFAVEADLRAHPPAGLNDGQRDARARSLDRLHGYAVRGVVPHNDRFAEPTPVFIDAQGTRCAMAALIEEEGGAAFVQRIARERNNATVHALSGEPELQQWLDANGMTVDEAARVQPSYFNCSYRRAQLFCGEPFPGAALFRVTREDGTNVHGTVDRTWRGDGGIVLGSEHDLMVSVSFPQFGRNLYEPGRLAFGFTDGFFGPYSVNPVSADGGVWSAFDRLCAVRPTISVEAAVQVNLLPVGDCLAALNNLDPAWLQTFCGSIDTPFDFCLADGGLDPSLAPDYLPPPPGPDAGSVDAGPPTTPKRTGCAAAPGPMLLLGLLLWRRKRA